MVYAALVASLATADVRHGALLMLAFGLGTLPNLLAIGASFGYVTRMVRSRAVRTAFAVLIAGIGVFGILMVARSVAHAAETTPFDVVASVFADSEH